VGVKGMYGIILDITLPASKQMPESELAQPHPKAPVSSIMRSHIQFMDWGHF
jgi:hypothetical protein